MEVICIYRGIVFLVGSVILVYNWDWWVCCVLDCKDFNLFIL